LFGSLARGEVGAESDVDLLVIMDTDKRGPHRVAPIRASLWGFGTPIDIMVRTPQEFDEGKNWFFTCSFSASQEGVVMYDKAKSTAVA
jgi:predicted nucleotidyltransferase